jgi:hypothetical protein
MTARLSRERVVAQLEKTLQEKGNEGKGPIALLQEFVQGSKQKQHALPANCKILQWSCDEMMVDAKLEFCATVRFLLDGLPHHATGTWQSCKAAAKRDAAQRALQLFVTCWSAASMIESQGSALSCRGEEVATDEQDSMADRIAARIWEAQELARYCDALRWSHRQSGQDHVASVELYLCGAPHTFNGCNCHSLEEACRTTASRVLWYLQAPGFRDCFELDSTADNAKDIPQAPHDWLGRDSTRQQEKEVAKQKTMLMHLQNRLQQAYSKQILAGKSAIKWSFDRNSVDRPNMVRATAEIPAISKTFTSDWQRTQRDAQKDACKKVSKFLDAGEIVHDGRS